MNRQEQLKNWLADRQRTYADGLALFRALATRPQRENHLAYLEKAPQQPAAFDPHFTQLVNQLARIERGIRLQPARYPKAFEAAEPTAEQVRAAEARAKEKAVQQRLAAIGEHEAAIEELKNGMMAALEESSEESEQRADELQERIDEHEEQIQQLQHEVDDLQKPGVRIVTEASMPAAIRKVYQRIREIAPLYASLHNDIANESLDDDARRPLAEQLCTLDDERRRLWQQIDDWSEGRQLPEPEPERPKYSDNRIVRGYEFARAVKRLRENIRNSQRAAEKAQADGRQVVYENALRRIERYEKELKEIEGEMNAGPADS